MPQFQAQVPHPLRNDLPAFLTRGRLTTPAIRVLFHILVGKRRFKGTTMQIHLDDIRDGERMWWHIGEEEFVDDARTRDPNPALLVADWMRRHHHAAPHALGSHGHVRAVIEAAHQLALLSDAGAESFGRCRRACTSG